MIEGSDRPSTPGPAVRRWAYALVPVLLLLSLAAALVRLNPLANLQGNAPPIESLTFDRVVLRADPKAIVLTIVPIAETATHEAKLYRKHRAM